MYNCGRVKIIFHFYRNAARSTKLKEYSEALDVLPLAEKANSTKHRLEELEMELKYVNIGFIHIRLLYFDKLLLI